MDFKKYFSEAQTVTVSVAKLGNQKLTKSMFNQIPIGRRIKYPFDFEGISILGFVNNGEHWVIYTEDERLFKGSLREIMRLLTTKRDKHQISTITYYMEIANPENYDDYDTFLALPVEEQEKYLAILDRMKLFFTSLKSHQIYL
ncbi:MAG: hypothetical protein L6264_07405 [Weeksellaceae bacterium]|nr:hypothetical protein [Bacteroidota bacterium]MCG2780760.1 hypothetical protein [Weeksellaceae bacterium]